MSRRKSDSSPRFWSRRRFGFLGLLCLTGCEPRSEARRPTQLRVAGPSMNPTLWGRHRRLECAQCRVKTRVDEVFVQRCLTRPKQYPASCWQCGNDWTQDQIRSSPWQSPDVVKVTQANPDEYRCGDLILVQVEDEFHIKRLLGRPGERIDRQPSGRLTNVDQPWQFSKPQVPVDFDQHRRETRWSFSPSNHWQRHAGGIWKRASRSPQDNMRPASEAIYQHRSVDRFDVASFVSDAYPGNLGLSRRLHPVDRVTAKWRVTRSDGTTHASQRAIDPAPRDGRLLFELFDSDVIQIADMQLWRDVEYADHAADSNARYPIELGSDQWFVAGDNGPVSIDSRHWGPVSTNALLGKVDSRRTLRPFAARTPIGAPIGRHFLASER